MGQKSLEGAGWGSEGSNAGVEGREARVVFRSPPAFDETANVFALVLPGDTLRIKLMHDYPDMKPEAGWRVESAGKLYEIKDVVDGVFQCEETEAKAEVETEVETTPSPAPSPRRRDRFTPPDVASDQS